MSTESPGLRIEGEMTIYRAAELKQTIADWQGGVPFGGAAAIDLSGVTEIDCSGVQLLALAQRGAAAAEQRLRLADPSPAVAEVLSLLGLDTLLSAGA
jgi:anti-anti-sigma factor